MSQSATLQAEKVKHWMDNFSMLQSMGENPVKTSLSDIQKQAILQFEALGFPTTRHEEWKYTSVLPLLKAEFTGAFRAPRSVSDLLPPAEESLQLKAHRLVLVNGFYSEEASSLLPEAEGIFVGSLATALEEHGTKVLAHFGRYAKSESEAFTALNTAFTQDGVCVIVPEKTALAHPVHILNIVDGTENAVFSNSRNLFIFGDRSEATLFEEFHSAGDAATWSNRITEVYVGHEANISLVTLQNDKPHAHLINQAYVKQEGKSNFSSTVLSMNGGIIRNNLTIRMDGEHSEAHMHGLYLLNGNTHVDNHTLVDHAMPNCYSNELYKGVMDGNSTGVFNGKIIVRPDAQKTNAFQSNKNILLSNGATINTKPQLEIFADDVKCSHGATTGRLDKDALFYIRSRGLGEKDAKALLTFAFASEVATFIRHEDVREAVETLISNRLYNH